MRSIPALAAILLLCVFSGHVQAQRADSTEWEVMEAVFRYQFEHIGGPAASDYVYFLKVEGRDPDKTFLQRFSSNIPPVKAASRSTRENNRVVDGETHSLGIIYFIDDTAILSETEAVVHGGYWQHGKSGSLNTYSLQKIRGKWTVVKDTLDWIS